MEDVEEEARAPQWEQEYHRLLDDHRQLEHEFGLERQRNAALEEIDEWYRQGCKDADELRRARDDLTVCSPMDSRPASWLWTGALPFAPGRHLFHCTS